MAAEAARQGPLSKPAALTAPPSRCWVGSRRLAKRELLQAPHPAVPCPPAPLPLAVGRHAGAAAVELAAAVVPEVAAAAMACLWLPCVAAGPVSPGLRSLNAAGGSVE